MKSRKTQNTVAAVLILGAILALIFQEKIWNAWQIYSLKADSRKVIAEVIVYKNSVQFRLPESLSYFNVQSGLELRSKDTIATGPDSTVVIRFKSGLEVEIQPNSLITLEDVTGGSDALQVSFIRGEIKVVNESGNKTRLNGDIISKPKIDSRNDIKSLSAPIKINVASIATPPPKALPKIQIEDKLKPATSLSPLIKEELEKRRKRARMNEDKETLPDSYITSVIRERRTFINRCYAQHLRLNPDARGRIDTSLKIEPDGSISTARVEASTISDPTLQQCVVSTLQRAKFKTFKGDAIIVKYPINFE